ncbi:MAG TPA: sigma-70 family RNA polymerase sigma factor [Candidatus Cloacimonadota bacterium]|nr:sigma-70 family RNA polymerase sigma factor [Candidatus Cloacimonadota bacterium]
MDKNKIVVEYLPLVRSIAAKYNKLGIPQEDLEQEGMIGLLEAADKFEADKGAKFSTYATYWIKKYILEAVDKEKKSSFKIKPLPEDKTPDQEVTELPKLDILTFPEDMPEAEKLVLRLLYQNQLTLKEISEQLEIPRERVRQLKEKAFRRIRAAKSGD